ncbi:methyl-accepting chemotaxis protein [Aquabacterium sp.]|uniref:methyl-accepting chemotaxis protein n=1 Tax=Aquabacterium sp. TaxID=1872578 RepID=UPI0035AD7D99
MRINEPVTNREYAVEPDRPLMSVTDDKGRITYCNPAFVAVSGFSEAELLGQAHNIVRHPDMPAEAFRDMWDTIRSGRSWRGLVKNRRKNGDHYWVWANASPLYDGSRIVGYVSVRTAPDAASIRQAEALYARMNAQAQAGRRTIGLRAGRVARVDLPGRILRRLLPNTTGQIFLTTLACTTTSAAAAALHPTAGAVAVLLSAAACAWAVARTTVWPLRRVASEANRLASGDLTVDIATDASGLPGELQRALSQLTFSLRTVVHDTRTEVKTLTGAIAEIATGNQDLSARTESQASNLQQTAASMEQISGTARQTNDSANRGAKTSQEMAGIAQASQEAVGRVADAMNSINASAHKMSEIIHVIEGVAFQTNILALNAAVEAARAGDAGRGFAVVAAEVRTLAQRTATAAREIKQLIDESTERVAAGNNETNQAAHRMTEAVSAVHNVTGLLSEIATAANEQQAGVAQISDAVSHMDSITQQNAAMVEQLAASAGALRDQVCHVTRTMRLLRLNGAERSLAEEDATSLRRQAKASATNLADSEAFDFSEAVAAHSAWKTKLRNAVLSGEQLDAATISRDDCCPLGKWLHGSGRAWSHKPSFVELVSRHQTFHSEAGSVAKLINEGQSQRAAAMLEGGTPYAHATQAVIIALRNLKSDVEAASPRSTSAKSASQPPTETTQTDSWETF